MPDKKLLIGIQTLAKLRDLFHAFFASIPNDWYRNNAITQFEGY